MIIIIIIIFSFFLKIVFNFYYFYYYVHAFILWPFEGYLTFYTLIQTWAKTRAPGAKPPDLINNLGTYKIKLKEKLFD